MGGCEAWGKGSVEPRMKPVEREAKVLVEKLPVGGVRKGDSAREKAKAASEAEKRKWAWVKPVEL